MRLALVTLVLVSCTPTVAPPATSVSPAPTNSAALSWRRVADITTPRSEVAVGVFRGVVYVVGGFGGGNIAEAYVADRWSAAARYPIAVDHAMAAGVDTAGAPCLYLFGGNVERLSVGRAFLCFSDQ